MNKMEIYAIKLSILFRYMVTHCAQEARYATYSRIEALLGIPRGGNAKNGRILDMGCLAGDLGVFCDAIGMPPLNSLCVRADTFLPGDGCPEKIGKKQGYKSITETQAACFTAYKRFDLKGIDAKIHDYVSELWDAE
jgi:hypothetical protein